MTEKFETKDSGKRETFGSGMQRDTQEGKTRFDLAFDGPVPGYLFETIERGETVVAFNAWYQVGGCRAAGEAIREIAKYEGGLAALFQRFAELMTRGAVKYEARNWMKAEGQAELERFKASAARHFYQWFSGNRDEDHAAAVVFNLNGAEYVRQKLEAVR